MGHLVQAPGVRTRQGLECSSPRLAVTRVPMEPHLGCMGGQGTSRMSLRLKGDTGVLSDARAEVKEALDVPRVREIGNRDAEGVWMPWIGGFMAM